MKKSYDTLIIGSSPAALLTAFYFSQNGRSCAVIDSAEQIGGLFRPWLHNNFHFSSHLEFLSNGVPSQFLTLLQNLLPHASAEQIELGPITFHNGQVQPFLGFGQTSFDAIDEGVHLTQPQRLRLNVTMTDIIAAFKEKFTGEILVQSQVTQLEIAHDLVKVHINNSDILNCESVYFYENPLWLSELLSKGQQPTPKSLIQKLGKTPLWTSVGLTYIHKHALTQSQALHCLSGAKEQICFGQFSTENNKPVSHWMNLVPTELTSDSEALAAILREMKKQIKRMYPSFMESVEKESISITANAYGQVAMGLVDTQYQLAKTPRLRLGGRFYSQTFGLTGDFSTLEGVFTTSPSQREAPTTAV